MHYLGSTEFTEANLYNIPIFRASALENMQVNIILNLIFYFVCFKYFEISPFSDSNWIITEEGYESLR